MGNDKKGAAYILAVFAVLLVLGIGAYSLFPAVFQSNSSIKMPVSLYGGSLVSIPRVETTIETADGQSHPISANVSVEIESQKVSDYDKLEMQKKVLKALSGLDYEKLNSDENVDYIKAELAKELSEYVSGDDLKGIYLTDISSGSIMFPEFEKQDSGGVKDFLSRIKVR